MKAVIDRRTAMKGLGAGATVAASGALAPVVLAQAPTDRRLVVVLLRGGLDGLAAVVPYADPHYEAARGTLAIAGPGEPGGALELDGRFAMHPALQALHGLYRDYRLAVFHAIATPYRGNSHFEAQNVLENGAASPQGGADGWLNRAIALMGPADKRPGLAASHGMPLLLRGSAPVRAWTSPRLPPAGEDFLDRLAALFRGDPVLGPALAEGVRAEVLGDDTALRRDTAALRAAAGPVGRMLADSAGPRIAMFETVGWDSHVAQGAETGRLANLFRGLAEGLMDLKDALDLAWWKTAIMIVTEFGRTVAPNRTRGTDHGAASAAFVLGGAVAGGRVHADWPGLGPDRLQDGLGLAPTADIRSVFKGLLIDHLRLSETEVERFVFPRSAHVPPARGLIRT